MSSRCVSDYESRVVIGRSAYAGSVRHVSQMLSEMRRGPEADLTRICAGGGGVAHTRRHMELTDIKMLMASIKLKGAFIIGGRLIYTRDQFLVSARQAPKTATRDFSVVTMLNR